MLGLVRLSMVLSEEPVPSLRWPGPPGPDHAPRPLEEQEKASR